MKVFTVLTQGEIDMNKDMSKKEIISIIYNLTKQKVPSPDGLIGEFYYT
jgi:hypothetical protein